MLYSSFQMGLRSFLITLVLTSCAEPSLTSTKASVTSFELTSFDVHASMSGRLDAAFTSNNNWPWTNVLRESKRVKE